MKLIPLTQGRFSQVDDSDFEFLSQFKWYFLKSRGGCCDGYAARKLSANGGGQVVLLMHRVLLNLARGEESDHEDGNGLNNQRNNLRRCTRLQNQRNRGVFKNNMLGIKGIRRSKSGRKFYASIHSDGSRTFLGSFDTIEAAVSARNSAEAQLFGEFARKVPSVSFGDSLSTPATRSRTRQILRLTPRAQG